MGSIPVRVTIKKRYKQSLYLFFMLILWNQNPVCFAERNKQYVRRTEYNFTASFIRTFGFRFPCTQNRRDKDAKDAI